MEEDNEDGKEKKEKKQKENMPLGWRRDWPEMGIVWPQCVQGDKAPLKLSTINTCR